VALHKQRSRILKEIFLKNKGFEIMNFLNEKEEQRSNEFKLKHCGNIHYEIYPTGIADKIVIVCDGCGKKEDISDYDSW
jgi:hypothetical protein